MRKEQIIRKLGLGGVVHIPPHSTLGLDTFPFQVVEGTGPWWPMMALEQPMIETSRLQQLPFWGTAGAA